MWLVGICQSNQGALAMLNRVFSAGDKVTQRQTYFGVKALTCLTALAMLASFSLVKAHGAERCPNSSPKSAKDTELFAVISVSSKSVNLHIGRTISEPFGSTVMPILMESLSNPLGTKIFTNAPIKNQDFANLLLSISQLKAIALKTVQEDSLYTVLSSTISNWEGSKNLALRIEDTGLSKKVVSVSEVEEGQYALFAMSSDPRQLNESLLIDVGSGRTKFSTLFIQRNKHPDLRVVSMDGISAIAHRAKINKGTFIEGLKKEGHLFSKEINENLDANPSLGRGTVILTGGIPYAMGLHVGAPSNTRFFKLDQKQIFQFVQAVQNCKSVEDLFPETGLAEVFTKEQLLTGATVINSLQQAILLEKTVYLSLNVPAWQLILGKNLSSNQSTK
jgi:hypothetical protein